MNDAKMKSLQTAAEAQATICVDPVRTQLGWYDTMTGISQKSGRLPAVATKYGLVTLIGIEFVPEGSLRIPEKHDYRLIGVLRAGASADNYDEFIAFLYEMARLLEAPRGEVVELSNTALTKFGLSLLDPGFKLPEAIVVTLSWPYRGSGQSGSIRVARD